VGQVVGLQCAVSAPELVAGVAVIDISLRMLHVKKQSLFIRPLVSALQTMLRETSLGTAFFKQVGIFMRVENKDLE